MAFSFASLPPSVKKLLPRPVTSRSFLPRVARTSVAKLGPAKHMVSTCALMAFRTAGC